MRIPAKQIAQEFAHGPRYCGHMRLTKLKHTQSSELSSLVPPA